MRKSRKTRAQVLVYVVLCSRADVALRPTERDKDPTTSVSDSPNDKKSIEMGAAAVGGKTKIASGSGSAHAVSEASKANVLSRTISSFVLLIFFAIVLD